jgi:hypothetical protein
MVLRDCALTPLASIVSYVWNACSCLHTACIRGGCWYTIIRD